MDAKSYAARNRDGHDWFAHHVEPKAVPQNDKVTVPDSPAPPAPPAPASGTASGPVSARAQMVKPVCNSNQWFKHNETDGSAKQTDGDSVAKPQPDEEIKTGKGGKTMTSACASWCIGGGDEKTQEAEHRSRVVTKAGEAYCLRDKSGSDWFSHETGSTNAQVTTCPRVGSKEGSNNASKMRGESENWFSHDPNAPPEPLHSSKGRPVAKAQGSDMFNVFHHDQ